MLVKPQLWGFRVDVYCVGLVWDELNPLTQSYFYVEEGKATLQPRHGW